MMAPPHMLKAFLAAAHNSMNNKKTLYIFCLYYINLVQKAVVIKTALWPQKQSWGLLSLPLTQLTFFRSSINWLTFLSAISCLRNMSETFGLYHLSFLYYNPLKCKLSSRILLLSFIVYLKAMSQERSWSQDG